MESAAINSGLPLNLCLYSSELKDLKKNVSNPIVINMISVWFDVKKYLDAFYPLSCFSPIWGNEKFKPGRLDAGFKIWADKGIRKIADLYVNNTLMSFEEIVNTYNIPTKHFFKYLQIRNFILKSQNNSLDMPPLSILEKEVTRNCFSKGLISSLYNMLVSGSKDSSNCKLEAWRSDLKDNIQMEDWMEACKEAQSLTMNTRLKLLQYKWLMRIYITPVVLHKYNENIPDTCLRCSDFKGTLYHCIWECEEVRHFWKDVKGMIEKILDVNIPLSPLIFLFHLYPEEIKLKKTEYIFINICILQAKRLISLNWKSIYAPNIGRWLKEMVTNMLMEKITIY